MKNRQRARRVSLNENHNRYLGSGGGSSSSIDVQIFTNTKEPNQVNLNSSSKLLASSATTTSAEAALPASLPVAQIAQQQHPQQQQQLQRQQQQQLIMPPTTMMGKYHPSHAKLRKCKSTPSLTFDGLEPMEPVEEDPHCRRISPFPRNTASEAKQTQQHEQLPRISGNQGSCHSHINAGNIGSSNSKCNSSATPTTPESMRFGCAHYKRRAMFVTPCCNKFYKCRFCHDENETHHFDRKTLTELICSECNRRQTVREQCENCGVRFGKYTCLICNLFDDADKQQYHCHGCGICRIGGAENFFHCEVCNMCLPIQLKIDGHRCVENISRSHCPVCLGDIHTSRIPCHIPDCGHLLHKMCFDQLLASGHYTCPTCQTSLIDMTALWEYLDDQAERMPVPLKYENQRVHIFCNDCHKTSKTKFHFIGLKCVHCGAYNTTQDVKRRLSLVTDEPSSA
ncbi:RING finger and CHY zinc finger domain-containing protein 1 [Drosophila biarmipes]|uniref:RING finger and CHY zinc finger domain-containing protein 1 n=1 Tax=Drosophila biarmipes TaxID=125945 RepID=UPI0007E6A9E1|nr:RING finger and CHY zinc finger domain-containing protein 1 [Drosophila biarmipes]XP_043950466.1 RING finger and CHY zinc finger domain-containing protein 1 [Drosophila biarmipes]XP_043950467.1 RING finger and CHY zinc finger domain-containing protein 1 [Drosophila biarmipes]XP_050740782.1 RING finger and CHY zinc finger domain-containing protein 1 [Drosophila biarmipes]